MLTTDSMQLFINFQNYGPEFSPEFLTAMYGQATGNGRVDLDMLLTLTSGV